MELYPNDAAAQLGVTLTSSILIVTNLTGNCLVIIIILTNKYMKCPMNYLLVNLAVADMMVGLFFLPHFVFVPFFTHPDGLAGAVMCKLLTGGNVAWFGGAASTVSLVIISFERYLAVTQPFRAKNKLSVQKVKNIVVATWIFAFVVTIPCFLQKNYDKESKVCTQQWPENQLWMGSAYSTVWFLFFGFTPVCIMVVLYSRVINALWFKRSEHQVQGTQLAMLKSRKRVTKMVVIVSVIYAVCWLPHSVMYMLYNYDVQHNYAVDVSSVCGMVFITCNSAINPFIYTLQSGVFRRFLVQLVCYRKPRQNMRHGKKLRDSTDATDITLRGTITGLNTDERKNVIVGRSKAWQRKNLDQTSLDSTRPDQSTRVDQTTPDHRPDQTRPDHPRLDQTTLHQTTD